MAETVGAIYVPSGSAEILDAFLRDLRLAAIDTGMADPPIQPGTDWYMLGVGLAEMALVGFANGAIADADRSILDATGDRLDEWRVALGLPEVGASKATGKIKLTVSGATTLSNGTVFLLPNSLRGQVVGAYVNPSDGDEVDVETIDVGALTNLRAGEIVRFVSPPTNIATVATVSTGEPLTGGDDDEDDGRKRSRILNVLRNKPAGGNWAHVRQIALDALGSVQDCYPYPAAGGPGSALVVPVRDFDVDTTSYTRALSSAALQTVRAALQAELPSPQEIVVRSAADQPVDFTILITIPDSALSGGNGLGWTDGAPWPPLVVADSNTVTITAIGAGNDSITVDAATTTSPLAGQTHIAWWSSVDMKFYTALVTAVSGATTAWVLTLDRPLVSTDGTGPSSGDYVCPSAYNLEKYGDAWVTLFRSLGPGEVTADADRLPRAKRHPYTADEDPANISTSNLLTLVRDFPEITDIAFGHSPVRTPTVPASVADAPNILVPRRLAFYAL